jgi:propionyl-CoA carboxylase alpha chain
MIKPHLLEGMDNPHLLRSNVTKLITYGETREEAIQIMIKAIEEYRVRHLGNLF